MTKKSILQNIFIGLIFVCAAASATFAQTTVFTYQGKLTDSGTPQTSYQMEFKLFGSPGGTDQIGSTITNPSVSVTQGVFTVNLDFGAAAFPGADRYLQISVRRSSAESFVTLNPRQQITSSPYSIRTLSAAQADVALDSNKLGGIDANQYVTTASVGNTFIKNLMTQQTGANFNIDGNGTAGGTLSANIVNTAAQYNIGGSRILTNAGTRNVFVGIGAGQANVLGRDNAFFGFNAGLNNIGNLTIGGNFNSFFGSNAGKMLTQGRFNSFFGSNAGGASTSGTDNAFFGANAGSSNSGDQNSFFGVGAGGSNTAAGNSFFGHSAGANNTSGAGNAFFGANAGQTNTTGGSNSFFGSTAGLQNTTGDNNSFFGLSAGANNTTGYENSFFGRSAGLLNTTGYDNSFFGRNAGVQNTTGSDNSFFGFQAGTSNTTGDSNSFFGLNAGGNNSFGSNNSFFGSGAGLLNTEGFYNSFVGTLAGNRNTTGYYNSFVGTLAGENNTTGSYNSFFGYKAGDRTTTGTDNLFFGYLAGQTNTTGNYNTMIGNSADVGAGNLTYATAIGASAIVSASSTIKLGRDYNDNVIVGNRLRVQNIPFGASVAQVCFNNAGDLLNCGASSLRLKKNVQPFFGGLNLIKQFNPISFDWKDGSGYDIGLAAEDVAKIDPFFAFINDKGEVQGVKYERLNILLINAVKEQQTQIERQNQQIDALTRLVCSQNRQAEICREK